ncbi:MAG: ATP-binding protein [Candidatus Thiodiazotropha sp.]
MPEETRLHFTQTLRFKLLLVSLSLVLIPWAGYQYLSEMESSLRHAQETLLLNRAEVVANMLATKNSDWLKDSVATGETPTHSLYVHPLHTPPTIDGYDEEWLDLKSQSRQFRANATDANAVTLDWLAGFHGDSIYIMVEISDQLLIYPQSERALSRGDHLLLALPGPSGKSRKYRIGTPAPGWVNVIEYKSNRNQTAISGEWQETERGYRVELRIPRPLSSGHLSIAAVDIDTAGGNPVGVASTSGWDSNKNLARLVMPTMQVDSLLQGLDETSHRYTVLNRMRQVIGRYGKVEQTRIESNTLLSRLIKLVSLAAEEKEIDARKGVGRLDGPEIRRALSGEGAVYRYKIAGSKRLVLSAAHPITIDNKILGSVLVEQSTQEILLLQQSALERLLLISLILFVVTGGTLLLFATNLTRRITRLSHKYNRAVSKDGRIIEEVQAAKDKDELGELDRSFSAVLKRSTAYTGYLESMASRLSHEFRTPLAMVKSSLEIVREETDQSAESPYIDRALDGTKRLNTILTRIGEASRLEQSLQNSEKEKLDITVFCSTLRDGYAITYPQHEFVCRLSNPGPIWIYLSPDLISQAIDKLVANAIDFHLPGSAIVLEVESDEKETVYFKVKNQGPKIAENDISKLFYAMESKRTNSDSQIHLGLGLYLVRLIAEFHEGSAWAKNETDGVCFTLALPYEK